MVTTSWALKCAGLKSYREDLSVKDERTVQLLSQGDARLQNRSSRREVVQELCT